jgi:hypothetical protein
MVCRTWRLIPEDYPTKACAVASTTYVFWWRWAS